MKLNLAVVVGLFDAKTRDKLKELNTLRNKCSHRWLLNVPARHKKRQKGPRQPLLSFRGRNIHKLLVLTEFLHEYGNMHYDMLARELSKEPKPSFEKLSARQPPSDCTAKRRRGKRV